MNDNSFLMSILPKRKSGNPNSIYPDCLDNCSPQSYIRECFTEDTDFNEGIVEVVEPIDPYSVSSEASVGEKRKCPQTFVSSQALKRRKFIEENEEISPKGLSLSFPESSSFNLDVLALLNGKDISSRLFEKYFQVLQDRMKSTAICNVKIFPYEALELIKKQEYEKIITKFLNSQKIQIQNNHIQRLLFPLRDISVNGSYCWNLVILEVPDNENDDFKVWFVETEEGAMRKCCVLLFYFKSFLHNFLFHKKNVKNGLKLEKIEAKNLQGKKNNPGLIVCAIGRSLLADVLCRRQISGLKIDIDETRKEILKSIR